MALSRLVTTHAWAPVTFGVGVQGWAASRLCSVLTRRRTLTQRPKARHMTWHYSHQAMIGTEGACK
jgi:hypothetical protein